MKKIFCISGSLRSGSTNALLIQEFSRFAVNYKFDIYPTLAELPYFSPGGNLPEAVKSITSRVQEADYFLISTPEYAHGYPGVLKNALDWLVADEKIPGKKIILFCASAGDCKKTVSSLTEVLITMSLNVAADRVLVIPAVRSRFKDGVLTSIETQANFKKVVDSLK